MTFIFQRRFRMCYHFIQKMMSFLGQSGRNNITTLAIFKNKLVFPKERYLKFPNKKGSC